MAATNPTRGDVRDRPESDGGGAPVHRRSGLLKAIGPGIIYAGAAIGGSHLVQSTRAGANFGFTLAWAVLAANVFKYPFFEFAQRYTAATGESLLHGYRRTGRWALPVYLLLAFGSSIPSTTAVTVVTAALASNLFGTGLSLVAWAGILLGSCLSILAMGRYPWLDKIMKAIMVALAVVTVITVALAAQHGRNVASDAVTPPMWDMAGIAFLVALMGWMPTPVDASVWPSLWAIERRKQTGHRPTLREALFDFNLGYVSATIMAVLFLSLGALIMFGTGEPLTGSGSDFAARLVGMYTKTLGPWSLPFISAVAFLTMLSTTLTVIDGYPRALQAAFELVFPRVRLRGPALYWAFVGLLVGCALLILQFLTHHLVKLIDFATTLCFLSAPVLAYVNWRAIRCEAVPRAAAPPRWMSVLSWLGLAFLGGFSIVYVTVKLVPK